MEQIQNARMIYFTTAVFLFAFLLSGCAQMLSPLKAGPAPDSGFLPAADHMPDDTKRFPFHRSWVTDSPIVRSRWNSIYIAPVDVSRATNHSLWKGKSPERVESYRNEVLQVGEFMRTTFSKNLGGQNGAPFRLVDAPASDSLILEVAIVELTPTDVARSAVSTALSTFVPFGGLVGFRSLGAIAIEGILRDGETGEIVFMFADRERGKMAPISLNDFTYFSHARDIITDWASQLAVICSDPTVAYVRDSLPLTLLPI